MSDISPAELAAAIMLADYLERIENHALTGSTETMDEAMAKMLPDTPTGAPE